MRLFFITKVILLPMVLLANVSIIDLLELKPIVPHHLRILPDPA